MALRDLWRKLVQRRARDEQEADARNPRDARNDLPDGGRGVKPSASLQEKPKY
jgi:hypothetical protein